MSFLQVQFVMVAYSELSLMSLMSQGLHALPVLQVNAHVRALGTVRLMAVFVSSSSNSGINICIIVQNHKDTSAHT
jgi:hypothetical protein